MRAIAIFVATFATLGLFATSSWAEIIDLGKHSVSEVRNACGSSFQPAADGSGYGCTKDCKGGKCTVACDNNNNCKGSTPDKVTIGGSRTGKVDLNAVLSNGATLEAAPATTTTPPTNRAPAAKTGNAKSQ